MAKKAILEVLESTIGRYVRNLDAESLNVAVWSGKIELQSLQLDTVAVNSELSRRAHEAPNLACPFRVLEGRFEKVQLDVPWARLSSRPVVFRAKGLHVWMEPHEFLKEEGGTSGWGERRGKKKLPQHVKSAKSKAMEERSNSIARAEAARKRANAVRMALEDGADSSTDDGDDVDGDSAKNSSTFTSRLVRRIVENLQFEIEDVHVAVRGCGCAAGVVLGSLSLVTTDAMGNRTFVDRQANVKNPASSFLYKELLISGLGIYLQSDNASNPHGDSLQRMDSLKSAEGREYVLSPLSFQAKLRQSDLDHCVDFPKYLIHSKLSSLSIQLTRPQLELGHRLALAVAPNAEVRPLFPEYRPLEPISGNAKQWWRYAVRCIGRLNRHRSWIEFFIAFQKRKTYLELYKRDAHAEGAQWLTKLKAPERAELEKIEGDRSISIAGLMHWRTIADAQVEKEREKHKIAVLKQKLESGSLSTPSKPKPMGRSSLATSLFGSAPRKDSSDEFYECLDDENDAPISLTVDEMKELEELAFKKADAQLSKDSMLCDINFTLGSFQVNLVKSTLQPLTSLEMGMVSTSFKANADGSFAFGLSLLSLEVLDSVTRNTFYPTICRSLQKAQTTKSHAFRLELKKTREGDQELVLKMVACEIVASPLLLFEVKEFFKLPVPFKAGNGNGNNRGKSNPILLESTSGEEDLFYDASEGGSTMLLSPLGIGTSSAAQLDFSVPALHQQAVAIAKDGKVSDKLSSAIVDAWNGKNQKKQKWAIDMDISAPILVLPENCIDPRATVLICNFGRFNFTYGNEGLSQLVTEWFNEHQRANKQDSEIDHLKLEMNNLSFTISSVGEATTKGLDGLNLDVSNSVIQPVSFTLDIGLEHTISSDDSTPRTCIKGVLPGIMMRLGPSHVNKVLRVAAVWSSNLHKLRGDLPSTEGDSILPCLPEEPTDLEIMSSGSGISILDAASPEKEVMPVSQSNTDRIESMLLSRRSERDILSSSITAAEYVHISVSLLRLSINIYTDNGDGIEAHLVSVVASSSLYTDGSSSNRLRMGWFWILDQLESEHKLPRRQRLVCHSNLPRSAPVYSENENYSAIMEDLTKQGVFKSNYIGSADLADIHITKLPNTKALAYHEQVTEFSRQYISTIKLVDKATVINAKFTSLFINWNPPAVKTLFMAKSNLLDFKEKAYSTYEQMAEHRASTRASVVPKAEKVPRNEEVHSIFILAQMETFEMSLNSAKDDMPLFSLTMCDSKVNHHSVEGDDENSEMIFVLGDFRLETPNCGKTMRSYQTLLGLAPSASTSLLTVKYCKGSQSVQSCNVGGANKSNCEACAEVLLSPMRFVHIHSQVFTLIEYVTEGVLGAMTASAASSAAAAAREVAKSSQSGEKLFYIVATGFDFVLPQGAYHKDHFSFHAGKLEAHYRSLASDVGSEAEVSLTELSMQCAQKMSMVSIPINMSISLKMKPPFAPLTEDERATRVDVSISRIQILIARCHYAQIMRTLEYNIGEQDNFLRAENSFQYNRSSSLPEENAQIEAQSGVAVDSLLKNLSHAGVENVEVIKRMYINFNIQELSVELCGLTTEDPIMSVAAVKAHILMKLLPDENQTKAFVALHDLVCDDLRLGSTDRTFRRMIGRASNNHTNAVSRAKLAPNDSEVFLLNYTKNGIDDSREIEVKIGSSVVIVLPDVITEILNFINVTPIQVAATSSFRQKPVFSEMTKSESLHVVVKDDGPEEFETCFESTKSDSAVSVKKTKYLVESSNMRLVLVDLGSMDSSGPFVSTKSSSALTETIVLQGKMKANFEMTSNIASNDNVEKDYKIDAERVEIYTAKGASLQHPVSILEPAKFSIFYYQKSGEVHLTDLKFVTLTPIDLTISMQNAALASALATSISDSFSTNKETSADEAERHSISAREARRIARLDSELERVEDIDEPMTPSEHSTDVSVHAGQQIEQMRKLTRLKMTSPEVILTLTNDFQGLDEALFKVIAMNWVFGGELDYPGASASEKPCFGFNMNTSFLADYFDTASNRWENFLTSPWEITLNGSRGPQSRFHSKRMSSTFDIESNPCHISFSEHFLVSAGAASRMWSVYSGATKQATHLVEEKVKDDLSKRRLSRSMAAHAARSLITTLPYAIENHSGINAMYSIYDDPTQHPLRKSSTQFFQFELFPERGTGGVRKYGQDVKHKKSLTIYIGKTEISIDDMDSEVQKPRSAHYISDYKTHVFTSVVKRGNSTVLHLSSHVEMYNSSSLPFRIAVLGDDKVHDLGIVKVAPKTTAVDGSGGKSLLKESEELMTHSKFGLPAPLLTSFMIDTSETLCLQISPVLKETNDFELAGMFNLPPLDRLVEIATSPQGEAKRVIEVSCSPSTRARNLSSLVANVCCKVTLVDSAHPFVQLFIEPRVVMTNRLPVSVLLRTPMPHTLVSSNSDSGEEYLEHADDSKYTTHELAPKESVEVFTPGPSIAISLTCADVPIGGTAIGWIEGGWLDIPLGKNKKILEPLNCTFPFETKSLDSYPSSRKTTSVGSGSEFFVLEADDVTPDLKQTVTRTSGSSDSCRTVVIMVCNYVVDHIGNILFEEVAPSDNTARRTSSTRSSINSSFLDSSPPFSAFSSRLHRRRVSLLPRSSNLIRLVQLTMDGDEGMKRSIPFRIEDVSMTEGIDAMPILWMDTTPTGFFVYRHLTTEGSELHVVPEYVVFNGSNEVIVVKQLSKNPFSLDSSKIYPIERDRNNSIVVQFDIPSLNALTGPVQIDKVGLRICVARSKSTGEALGSLAVQTVIGARDSRLVIKIGAFNAGEDQSTESSVSSSLFEHDFIRFRVRWSEMRVTLKDTSFGENEKYEENRAAIRKYLEHHNINSSEVEQRLAEVRKDYNKMIDKKRDVFPEVAQILLHRFTVDFQRIFKDNEPKSKGVLSSNERSQFSVVIHNVRITDCSPNTSSSVVFDSMSEKSFFDLCVRTRGPLNADLIRVDLVDLNLAYGDGKAEKIVVNTGEDFVWRLLDIANRTMLETANLAGVDLSLKWDESAGKFSVSISDPMGNSGDDVDLDGKYCPPRSDKLYDVKKLRVSPFLLLLSFKRQPQSSRYKLIRGVRGAKLANYFTTRLKFTIDRAELRFQGYMARDIKGPPDRLADTIKTVYATQLKTKMIALMTATSFQDWKYLTARDSGGEEFIEGDLLRMTGNLTGRSAKYVLKKLGDGIGDSVVAMTGTIGGGIQDATESIGIGYVGAGVNSLISGVGEGVGSTVKGVGTGAGDILRGAGKGIGQAFGGIGGGVQQVTKGIGRGVTHGDLSGVGEGFASMGNGLGQGVETVVDGTVSGVLSVSKGLFSGAKSVGKGVGGFFTGGRDVGGKTPPKGPPKQR